MNFALPSAVGIIYQTDDYLVGELVPGSEHESGNELEARNETEKEPKTEPEMEPEIAVLSLPARVLLPESCYHSSY